MTALAREGQTDRVTIQVATTSPFGHSGPEPTCPAVGRAVEFLPDAPLPGLTVGMKVSATEQDVWWLTADGGHHSHTQSLDFLTPPPLPVDTTPTPITIERAPAPVIPAPEK